MLYQESSGWSGARARSRGTAANPVAVLAYRSRPVTAPSVEELDRLLRSAQERNRSEGLTGLLVYDRGCFFQWLEGPDLGVMRVWNSIRRDPRHTDFKILRQQTVPKRFFGWHMRLARRSHGEIDRALATMKTPHELLRKLRLQPSVLTDSTWDQVFADAVLPRLRPALPTLRDAGLPRREASVVQFRPRPAEPRPPASIWHAHRGAGDELAKLLLEVDPADAERFVDGLLDHGAGLEPLFHEVFEPAARCLGGLWEADRCDDFHVTLAMGRLQVEVRRLGLTRMRPQQFTERGQAILIAPQPGEPHGLGASMSCELFLRDGWDVSCEISSDNNMLKDILHGQWFDVLEISSSGALRRDHQLPALRGTIRAARAASLNPALAVIVDGRSFVERPEAYLEVGADLGCISATYAVPAAHQLLRIRRMAHFALAGRR
jgi:methanogenic corrinoid protein MtbC1